MTRKLLGYLIALTMLLSLAAPLTASADLEPLSDGSATLSVYWNWGSTYSKSMTSLADNIAMQEFEKMTGVKIEWVHPAEGQNQEQFNLLLTSGNLPDIICPIYNSFTYPGGAMKALSDGVYIKLNELVEAHSKYFWPLVNSSDEFLRDVLTDDGTLYGFPMVEETKQGTYDGTNIRQDWLDDLGLATPETIDELESVLIAFKEQKGATAPYILQQKGYGDYAKTLTSSFDTSDSFYHIDGVVHWGAWEDNFKAYLAKMNDWYKKGLIAQDFSTMDNAQRTALITTGKAGVWQGGFWMFDDYRVQSNEPDKFRVVALAAPTLEKGGDTHIRPTNSHVRGDFCSITSNCQNPELAVKWMDYWYSPEAYELFNWGVEGQAFVYNDQGEREFTPLIADNPDGLVFAEALAKYAIHSGPFNRMWDRERAMWTDDEYGAHDIWSSRGADWYINEALLSPTAEEGDELASIMADINTLRDERVVNWIMGVEPLDTFEEYQNICRGMGIERAIEIKQQVVSRYLAR